MLLGLSPKTNPAHISQSEVNILAENMALLAQSSGIFNCFFLHLLKTCHYMQQVYGQQSIRAQQLHRRVARVQLFSFMYL